MVLNSFAVMQSGKQRGFNKSTVQGIEVQVARPVACGAPWRVQPAQPVPR
jgi:hypothetical protein